MRFLQEMIAKKRAQHGLQDTAAPAEEAAAPWSAPQVTPTPVPPRRPEPPADWAVSSDDAADEDDRYDDDSYDWDLEGEDLPDAAAPAGETREGLRAEADAEEEDHDTTLVLRDVVSKSRPEPPVEAHGEEDSEDFRDAGYPGGDAWAASDGSDAQDDDATEEAWEHAVTEETWEDAAEDDEPVAAAPAAGPAMSSLEENIEKLRVQRKIWDMEEDDTEEDAEPAPPSVSAAVPPVAAAPARVAPPAPAAAPPLRLDREHPADRPAAEAAPPPRRAGRVKTRLLGFHKGDDAMHDPFAAAAAPAQAPQGEPQFPVGWMVVVEGPGRGASFTLTAGASKIGRGEDQAVRLDFGDTSISRDNHAAVAYDDEQRCFYIGHGGKANLVRLNDMPVLSTEPLNDGDLIRIGETTLLFIALCGPEFSWQDDGDGDSRYAAAE